MRQKIIAWCAAILIVVLVSYAFLRPAPVYFGYADVLYTPWQDVCEPLALSGDTQYVERIEYRGIALSDGFCSIKVRIYPADGAPKIKLPYSERHVTIEGKPEQGLEYVNEVCSGFMVVGFRKYIEIEPGTEYCDYQIDFPYIGEPGEYVLTLKFVADGDRAVSFPLTVRSTDFKADVAAVELFIYNATYTPIVQFGLRLNDGMLYLDRETMRLDVKTDDGWMTLTAPDGSAPLAIGTNEKSRYLAGFAPRLAYVEDGELLNSALFTYPGISFELGDDFDPDAEYRITMNFVENEDGSGERHTLQLRINFSEEEQQ